MTRGTELIKDIAGLHRVWVPSIAYEDWRLNTTEKSHERTAFFLVTNWMTHIHQIWFVERKVDGEYPYSKVAAKEMFNQ